MSIQIGRVRWPGPVGIGAGMIKGAGALLDYANRADSVEIGSITKRPRNGNPGQTVWKYSPEKAVRHNAGLPNPGAAGLATQMKSTIPKVRIPWGISVAVTPGITDAVMAAEDVADTVEMVITQGLTPDWITFNCSSPDTEDSLAMLSEPVRVHSCLQAITQVTHLYNLPVWLKVGTQLPKDTVKALSELAIVTGVQALVVGNAMPDPHGLPGGWCGVPTRAHMLSAVWQYGEATQKRIPIVAAGGIQSGKDVQDAFSQGAVAVQVASALVFLGRDAALSIRREFELLST